MADLLQSLNQLFLNKVFLSVFFSWLTANIIKVVVILFSEKKFELSSLYRSGGMPSAHTSSVVGLSFGLLLFDGVTSVFILSLAFAIVVIHDAMGVRLEAERHARFLNDLIKRQKSGGPFFLEHIGHKFSEVLGGVLVGLIIPVIISLI